MSEIMLISSYMEITELSKELAKEMNLKVTIIESALNDAVEIVGTKINSASETIIISRPATANLLIKRFPEVRILLLEINEYDLIQALYQAKLKNKKVGVLGSVDEISRLDIEYISGVVNMRFSTYMYAAAADFDRMIEDAQKDGIEVLIGGGNRGRKLCEEKRLMNIGLNSGRTAIYQTLKRAADIIITQKKEKETFEYIRTIVELSDDAIVAVDSKRKVVVFNQKAAKLFHVPVTEAINKSLDTVKFNKLFSNLFDGPPINKGEIHKINERTVLVKRATFEVLGEHMGIVINIQDVSQIQASEVHIRRELFLKGFVAKYTFDDLIYQSEQMKKVIEKAIKFSRVDSNVLIIGESGTGKELMAQSVHNEHPLRHSRPFVAINCAALSESLLESELFGYEKGAFTGANKEGKAGLFELAHGGTIFLDEIGKVSLELQSKLLRILQEREVRRIGGERNIPVDVRVIAAANEDLRSLIEQNKFRNDLYYRLEILSLYIPPLRKRREDIPLLIEFMLKKYANKYNKTFGEFNNDFYSVISQFEWTGNIRQLENIVERAVVMTDSGEAIDLVMQQLINETYENYKSEQPLAPTPTDENLNQPSVRIPVGTMEEMERHIVKQIIERGYSTKKNIANILGISRTTLWKLLKED